LVYTLKNKSDGGSDSRFAFLLPAAHSTAARIGKRAQLLIIIIIIINKPHFCTTARRAYYIQSGNDDECVTKFNISVYRFRAEFHNK